MFTHFVVYFLGTFLFKIWLVLLFNYENFFDGKLPDHSSYDFIIVGSGSSAGSLIASSLKGKVLVIEAGSDGNSFLMNIPIIQPLLQRSPYDWSFETASQKDSCQALKNNQSFWPVGKIQGGTHRLNNMVYHRGHESDYENFIPLSDAEIFFNKNERNIPVSKGKFQSSFGKAFVEAGDYLGFDNFHLTNLTQFKGRRYTEIDNWKKLENPPENCLHAMVTRILFDDLNPKKAVGVEFMKHNKLHKVYGNKIILSAGAIGSPKILLHSGIGPKNHLEEIGMEVRESLPVGENLQDHVTTGLDLIILNQTVGLSLSELMNPFKVLDYFWYNGEGSPMSLAGCDAMGFVKLGQSDAPDLSFMSIPLGLTSDQGIHLRKIVNIRDDIWNNHFKPLIGQTTVSILPILLHPKSKGTIRLKSKDFLEPLIINPNYLSDLSDVKKLITGIRIIEKLIESPSMQKLGAEINPMALPGCKKFSFDSNDYWECYIRQMTLTMFHPVGTCKMGEKDDDSTVVLGNFQVKNIENVYVVDGSVLPKAPSANPHAIIAMFAQKFLNDNAVT